MTADEWVNKAQPNRLRAYVLCNCGEKFLFEKPNEQNSTRFCTKNNRKPLPFNARVHYRNIFYLYYEEALLLAVSHPSFCVCVWPWLSFIIIDIYGYFCFVHFQTRRNEKLKTTGLRHDTRLDWMERKSFLLGYFVISFIFYVEPLLCGGGSRKCLHIYNSNTILRSANFAETKKTNKKRR